MPNDLNTGHKNEKKGSTIGRKYLYLLEFALNSDNRSNQVEKNGRLVW